MPYFWSKFLSAFYPDPALNRKQSDRPLDQLSPISASRNSIELQRYVDIYNDSTGWYALGHHSPKRFLQAIAQQLPNCRFTSESVIRTWAIVTPQSSQIFVEEGERSVPITLIECQF
jgi:hypothetical protein